MSTRWAGIHVTSDAVVLVFADVPDAGAIVVQSDTTIPLEAGERANAYRTMLQTISDFLRQNQIREVAIKASAVNRAGTKMAHLLAAELRGVVAAAASSSGARVHFLRKQTVSKTFGKRKVDEYLKDKAFWAGAVAGDLRVASREACFLVLAATRGGERDAD